MNSPLRIGIAGLGTVGAGVVKLLAEHGRLLAVRGGRPLKIVAVSARTGLGLDELRARLVDLVQRLPTTDPDADVRLWVDRRSWSTCAAGPAPSA